ncbi:hypothetical protein AJ80_09005 [Polytolypa hystricis UAMH7299]|uniref:RING-type domain-containing protein n=1 Tax=Polytolypa hystricis (strain UAMH7299) TaxID=1447883 RepID=A0A2B7WXJ3_POLH7|nr:hypothetical protein AJ80_09005 [Polytolypa hystricis UAMH7299]
MPDGKATGGVLLDLEAELTCSICTELLYQPLTLLDCLHTFCGSCLKEWFSWQSSNSGRNPQSTCPSCRATVRDTRHDAKVNTLLELFLQSNPSKAKPAEEKAEIEKKYKHNVKILPERRGPSTTNTSASDDDDEDRRLLAEVREMSLRDVDDRRRRTGSRPSSSRRERSSARREREQQEEAQRRRRAARQRTAVAQQRGTTDPASRTRQVEHQSSLRSLLSSSDGDAAMEEEILRQIMEEGLLDGIDIQSLDPAQEDELSERIAEAYRRRHMNQSTSRPITRSAEPERSEQPERRQPQPRASGEAERTTEQTRRPPVSRPHLLEPTPHPSTTSSSHRRSSSDTRTRRRTTSPNPRSAASSAEALIQPAARSSTDLSRPRRSSQNSLPTPSFRHRATSSLSGTRQYDSDGGRQRGSQSAGRRVADRPITDSPTSEASPTIIGPAQITTQPDQNLAPPSNAPPASSERSASRESRDTARPSSSRPSSARSSGQARSNIPLFTEPSISCSRCNKPDIQYELHKFCNKCNNGDYHICLRCYRLGRGCLHWFGFGPSAQIRFEQKFGRSPSSAQETTAREPPHILSSHRYASPPRDVSRLIVDETRRRTSDDPAKRLQSGMFCDMCHAFTDECFWKCSQCNEGEWGFCNQCVNQGKCCTHPLLPIARVKENTTDQAQASQSSLANTPPNTTPNPSAAGSADTHAVLSFTTNCNICSYPIPPSVTRFHCPTCNDGNYDICTNCYLRLCATGRISKENGRNGWRRCSLGHRMMIIGFYDHSDGQKRAIVKGLVGGFALKDEWAAPTSSPNTNSTPTTSDSQQSPNSPHPPTRQGSGDWNWIDGHDANNPANPTRHKKKAARSRNPWSSTSSPTAASESNSKQPPTPPYFPPSGGIGLRVLAIWPYYPDPEDTDEIFFPRGAEITEAEDINDDWLWGCYAGQKGLFPGQYVQALGEVTLQ